MMSEFCVRHKLGEEELKELTKLVDDTIVRIGRCLISAPVAAKEPVAAPVATKEPVAAKEPVAKKPPVVKEAVPAPGKIISPFAKFREEEAAAKRAAASATTTNPATVKSEPAKRVWPALSGQEEAVVAKEPLPPPPVPAHLRGLVMEEKEQKEQKEEEEEEINALKVKKTIKRPIAWMKKQQQMMVK
jgi:hypothetical protein